MVLQAAARIAPGIVAHVVGLKIIVGPDIESELGLTAGDLDGGEVAPDQMFGFRPFGNDPAWADGRTPIGGLYLTGPSAAPGPFFLGLSGERAALAILADLKTGGLA
jgi:phytoene dehydrogenase-like protein